MTCNYVQMFLLVYTKSQEESLGRGLFISCTKQESRVCLTAQNYSKPCAIPPRALLSQLL